MMGYTYRILGQVLHVHVEALRRRREVPVLVVVVVAAGEVDFVFDVAHGRRLE